jgi:hypothetical protein
MAKDILLRIAEIGVALHCDIIENKIYLQGAIQKFLVHQIEPEISIRVRWDELHQEALGRKIFDSGTIWKLYDCNGSYLIRLTAPLFGPVPYKEALFNPDFSRGEIRLHRPFFSPEVPLYPLEYPLDELLITNYLARGKGVEVHACGIVDANEKGYLFLGSSGAGKSTMAKLWQGQPGVRVLSDDRIILRREGRDFWIHGTPWHGDAGFSSPGRALLKSAYFLERGLKNEGIPLRKAEASGRLFASSFPPFYSMEAIEFILDFLGKMVDHIPVYELRFFPDQEVVHFLQELA